MSEHFPQEFRNTLFKLDPRSLLAFRLLLATALFTDLAERFVNTGYFFTESGIFPEPLWDKIYGFKPYYWSLHFIETEWLVWALVALQVVLAGCLVMGYRLRITFLVSWVLLLSMNLGNPLLTYGGDKLSPALLLIAALLPLTAAQRNAAGNGPLTWLAGLLVLTQVTMLYTAAGAAKIWQTYWLTGDALYNAMHFNLLVKPLGIWATQFETVLRIASWVTPWCEIALPMLLWVPSWGGRIRTLGILGLLGLNAGIWLTMDVGYFMFYASAALICLLPAVFWETVGPLTARLKNWLLNPSFSLGTTFVRWVETECVPADSQIATNESRPMSIRSKLQMAIMVWLILVFSISGLEGMKVFKRVSWPAPIWNAIRAPNLYQNWGLFTNPNTQLQWYVGKAQLANEQWVDIIQDGPVSYPRPRGRPALFQENFRWRLAFAKANKHKKHAAVRQAIAANLVAKWNAEHPQEERVVQLEIFKMSKVLSKTFAYKRHWKTWATWGIPPKKT